MQTLRLYSRPAELEHLRAEHTTCIQLILIHPPVWGPLFKKNSQSGDLKDQFKHLLVLLLLLLLLSRFSRVQLCVTPETTAHQAPPSLGFSRQEQWSGLPFPSPMHESEKWKWSHSVCLTHSDPAAYQVDCSLPSSSVHGIFQARVLEWGAIAFSSLTLRHHLS